MWPPSSLHKLISEMVNYPGKVDLIETRDSKYHDYVFDDMNNEGNYVFVKSDDSIEIVNNTESSYVKGDSEIVRIKLSAWGIDEDIR